MQTLDEAKDSVPSIEVREHEILTGSVDGHVRCYDIRMGRLRVDFIGEPVTCVSFSRDGKCVLASSLDNTIRLLDKETGELLADYSGHKSQDFKVDCCLSHNDAFVVSGSEDGRLCFWDLVSRKRKRRTCKFHTHTHNTHNTTQGLWKAAEIHQCTPARGVLAIAPPPRGVCALGVRGRHGARVEAGAQPWERARERGRGRGELRAAVFCTDYQQGCSIM
jgi:hypothetical protein